MAFIYLLNLLQFTHRFRFLSLDLRLLFGVGDLGIKLKLLKVIITFKKWNEKIRELLKNQGIELYFKKKAPQKASKAIKQWFTALYATMSLMPQIALTYASVSWIQTLTCWGRKKIKHKPVTILRLIRPLESLHALPPHTCASSS